MELAVDDYDPIIAEGLPPQSYLFFIVAKIGPRGSHRPVAVALCQGGYGIQSGIQGRDVARYTLQTIAILSDPGNRTAINAELNLAADFYKNDTEGILLPRVKLPELSRWSGHPSEMSKRMRVWDHSLPKFPILATCLQLGIGYNTMNGSEDAVKKEELGTVYYDDSLEYGMVVLDISDLDDIHYGIIGLSIHATQKAFGTAKQKAEPPLGKHVRRRPLSAVEFMSKFYPKSTGDLSSFGHVVNRLQEYSLITVSAMEYIWPSNDNEDATIAHQASQPVISDNRSPSDEAISSLIDNISNTQNLDMSVVNELRIISGFQITLRSHLRERLGNNDYFQPKILGQLLGIAFDAQQYLDWVTLKGLDTHAIAFALRMAELKEAKSISLCIDTIHGTYEQLLESLSVSTGLRELYFLQEPTRENDNNSAELLVKLLSTSHPHLLRCKIIISGPFSSSLSKRFWLPTTDWEPDTGIFPTKHMFVRRQISGSGKPVYSPQHFYLGDALLKPERFAAGFLQFLRSLITGETMMPTQLYSLVCASSTLKNMSSREISSIPVENFTIPVRPVKGDVERRIMAGLLIDEDHNALIPECWPKIRDLVPGDWAVLVSKDRYYDLERARTLDHNIFPYPSCQARLISYAFVRVKTLILVEDVPENLGPEMVEVCGLKEFLQCTAPEVDQNLVDQCLRELEVYVSKAPDQIPLDPEMDWVSVLEPQDAYVVLKDFLEDAAYVKGNLRLAMKDDLERRNWYPELLRGDTEDDTNSRDSVDKKHARNKEVFIVSS